MKMIRNFWAGCTTACLVFSALAADPAPSPLSAVELATKLSGFRENASSDVRLRMEVQQPIGTKKATFQIQIKERRTAAGTDVAYIILWPKERKGETLIVHQDGGPEASAVIFLPGAEAPKSVAMNDPVFGSDLAIADTVENFFAWKDQKIVGMEVVDRVNCQILESKPGGDDSSIYGRVRSWIDLKKLVPLRVEKYSSSGKLARRIDTTRVVPQGEHGNLPANLSVSVDGNSVTELDGSRIRWDAQFSDRDFSPEGITQ